MGLRESARRFWSLRKRVAPSSGLLLTMPMLRCSSGGQVRIQEEKVEVSAAKGEPLESWAGFAARGRRLARIVDIWRRKTRPSHSHEEPVRECGLGGQL